MLIGREQRIMLLAALGVGALVLWGAWALPLSTLENTYARPNRATESTWLKAGEAVQQSFLVKDDGLLTGIVFYSHAPVLEGRRLAVRVLDQEGQLLAEGQHVETSYNEDLLALTVAVPWVEIAVGDELVFEVALVEGPQLPISVARDNMYKQGTLVRNDGQVGYDMAFGVINASRLSVGAQLGVSAGLVFMLGLVLVTFLGSRWRWVAAGLLVAVVTPLALGGFWFSDGDLGIADWDYYFSLHEVYRRTIVDYHQFPLWNPYTCGGTAGIGDPEFPVISATFLLELIFGIPIGVRLAVFLTVIVTAWGVLALARRLRLSVVAGAVAAVAVAFSSVSLLEIVEGHVNVWAAMWIPWIFWAWLGAYRENVRRKQLPISEQRQDREGRQILRLTKHSLLLSVFLALTFYAGGIYLLMYTGLAFLFLVWLVSDAGAAVVTSVRSGVWALGLAAFKLVPVLLWLRQFPDESYQSTTTTWPWLYDILLGRHLHGSYEVFGQGSGWHEYGAYIGWLVLGLALLGAARWRTDRVVRGLVIAAVGALLLSSAGPALEPFFDQMPWLPRSAISRIILLSVIAIGVLAGYGVERIRHLAGGRVVVVILAGLLAVDLMSLSYQLSEQALVLPDIPSDKIAPAAYPIAYTKQTYDYISTDTKQTRTYAAVKAGYGVFAYCSVLGPGKSSVVRTIHDEEANEIIYLGSPTASYEVESWTPNRVRVRVSSTEPTNVVLNGNQVEGWFVNDRASQGDYGRISGELPAGEHMVEFVFRPPGLALGIGITTLTLILVVWRIRRSA